MPTEYHRDDVRVMLSYPTRTDGGGRAVNLDAEHADTGDHLFMLRLSPADFTALMSSRATVARSVVPVPRLPQRPTHPPVRWLEVTLTATTNPYVQVPCAGQVQVTEYSNDGYVIKAIFRRRGDDGALCAPVEIADPQWAYLGRRPQPGTEPCPDPSAHEYGCAETDSGQYGDCHGIVREYIVSGQFHNVCGQTSGEEVPLCASHAQIHGPKIRKPLPAEAKA